MSQIGIGAMLGLLSDNSETVASLLTAYGKTIASIKLEKDVSHTEKRNQTDELQIEFTDGSVLRVWDDGQSCCESRYMSCDDDLQYHVGAKLVKIEVADAPDVSNDECDVHEVQFLKVDTDKGGFTFQTHNEHNGYYGGFNLEVRLDLSNVREEGLYPSAGEQKREPIAATAVYKIYRDGDSWCAIDESTFVDLQTSAAGVGASPSKALANLLNR